MRRSRRWFVFWNFASSRSSPDSPRAPAGLLASDSRAGVGSVVAWSSAGAAGSAAGAAGDGGGPDATLARQVAPAATAAPGGVESVGAGRARAGAGKLAPPAMLKPASGCRRFGGRPFLLGALWPILSTRRLGTRSAPPPASAAKKSTCRALCVRNSETPVSLSRRHGLHSTSRPSYVIQFWTVLRLIECLLTINP